VSDTFTPYALRKNQFVRIFTEMSTSSQQRVNNEIDNVTIQCKQCPQNVHSYMYPHSGRKSDIVKTFRQVL
jgi:hypothetical protein